MDYEISLLADHINGRTTTDEEQNIDWDAVIENGKNHEITGFLYFQCKSIVPDQYRAILDQQYGAMVFYYANRLQLEKDILALLERNGIQGFLIKGSAVASYYPYPALRTMGDTDLVVHAEDRGKVHELLLKMGCRNRKHNMDREWQYFKDDMEIELHDRLVYPKVVNVEGHAEFFNDLWKYVKNGKLDWSFHFLFLIFHLRKHFMNSGVGLRQFMDIAVLTKENQELNWPWIVEKLKDLNMWEFAQRVFALNEYWFEIASPVEIMAFEEEFLTEATKQILKNGIFGFDDEGNQSNLAVNYVRNGDKKNVGMRSFLKGMFPCYDLMIKAPHYSFLKGRSFLLPLAWIYRMGRTIMRREADIKVNAVVKRSFVSKRKVQEREETLKKWGL